MKLRVTSLITVFALALLLTGCGSNKETKLVCTQSANGANMELNIGFKGDKVVSVDLNCDMDFSSYSDDQIELIKSQDFCTLIKSSMGEYADAFTNCDQNIVDKHLKLQADLDVNKMAKSEADKISTPAEAKKTFESEGYSCK